IEYTWEDAEPGSWTTINSDDTAVFPAVPEDAPYYYSGHPAGFQASWEISQNLSAMGIGSKTNHGISIPPASGGYSGERSVTVRFEVRGGQGYPLPYGVIWVDAVGDLRAPHNPLHSPYESYGPLGARSAMKFQADENGIVELKFKDFHHAHGWEISTYQGAECVERHESDDTRRSDVIWTVCDPEFDSTYLFPFEGSETGHVSTNKTATRYQAPGSDEWVDMDPDHSGDVPAGSTVEWEYRLWNGSSSLPARVSSELTRDDQLFVEGTTDEPAPLEAVGHERRDADGNWVEVPFLNTPPTTPISGSDPWDIGIYVDPDGSWIGALDSGERLYLRAQGVVDEGDYRNCISTRPRSNADSHYGSVSVGDSSDASVYCWSGRGIIPVTPQEPEVVQTSCPAPGEPTDPQVTLAQTEGITYAIEGDIEAGATITVVATPEDGYVLEDSSGWTLASDGTATFEVTLDDVDCDPLTVVIPETPTLTPADACGVEATVTLPDQEGVDYTQTRDGDVVTVTAEAEEGFEIDPSATTEWTLTIPAVEECITPVTPVQPEITQAVCEAPGDVT
ncbi:MAG TPA: hypothetical protein VK054_06790, partial [Beutenbergiaceae bacterium]|nr:hypothetical protein [Beutenbergiaceae bacterium]